MANFVSSACRHEEHELCQVHGKIRLPQGKTVKCICQCHPPVKQKRKRVEDDSDD